MLDLEDNIVAASSETARVTLAFLEFAAFRWQTLSHVTLVPPDTLVTERTAKVSATKAHIDSS